MKRIFKLSFLIIFLLIHNGLASTDKKILAAKEKVFPALVHIQPIKEVFAAGEKKKVQVTGSGVIFRPDGYVLTNNHVAEKADYLRCTLSSRKELEAKVVGLDPWTDLAVLKLDLESAGLKEVPFARFGDSDSVQVGQSVLALGSPLGLSRSLSRGVISSVDRYFDDVGEMISPFNLWLQTDAAINPGNSGGPLVDLDGRVIGINSRAVIYGQNLGFAIPINTAKYVIGQILEKGEVQRSWIGIKLQEIKEYRKYVKKPQLEGVLIAGVDENSPAQKAGLKPGDLVLEINKMPVSAVFKEELPPIRLLIANMPIHSKIVFTVLTNDKLRSIEVSSEKQGEFSAHEFECSEWGFSVKEITPRIKKNFQLDSQAGVLISGVRRGSPAEEGGVIRGYVLSKIDNRKIKDLHDFKKKYALFRNDKRDHLLYLHFSKRNRFALITGGTQ